VLFLTELAAVKVVTGQTEQAVKIYQDILILDPENSSARTYLGTLG